MTESERPIQSTHHLLVSAVHGSVDSARRAFGEWSHSVDIMNLDAVSFRLIPQLYLRAVALEIDDAPLAQLRSSYQQSFYRNNLLLERSTNILSSLSGNIEDPVVIGDVAFAASWYADRGARRVDALQIVVRPDDHRAACEVVSRCKDLKPVDRLPRWARGLHGARSFSGDHGFRVDVLNQFSIYGYHPTMSDDFHSRSITARWGTDDVRILSPADQLLLTLIEHAGAVDGLDWISDAATLMGKESMTATAPKMAASAARYRVTVPLRSRLNRLQGVLNDMALTKPFAIAFNQLDPSPHEELEFRIRTSARRQWQPHRWYWHHYKLRYVEQMTFIEYLQRAFDEPSILRLGETFVRRLLRRLRP